MTPLDLLDHVGVALFAATGVLTASRKQLDLVGFLFLGTVTGVGGGTVRDLVLDVPVFWVQEPVFVLTCATMAVTVFLSAHLIESRYSLLLWLDAAALAAYAVFGAHKGLEVSGSPTVALVTGMATGTLGGIIRDIVAREPSVLLRWEIYVTAAMAGAAVYVTATALGLHLAVAAPAAFGLAFVVRGGAVLYGWRLPAYRSRPGRDDPAHRSEPWKRQ